MATKIVGTAFHRLINNELTATAVENSAIMQTAFSGVGIPVTKHETTGIATAKRYPKRRSRNKAKPITSISNIGFNALIGRAIIWLMVGTRQATPASKATNATSRSAEV